VTPRRVVIAANSAWHIANFRAELIRSFARHGYEPIVVAPADRAGRVQNLGVEHVDLPFERSGLNPFADLALLLRYRQVLKRLRPAAFLGFTIKPNIYGGIAAASLGIPPIANISGLGTAFIRRGPLQVLVTALYRFALRGTSVVFFQNPDDRALFLERRLVRANQALLLPGSGVDLDRFTMKPLPDGPPAFLFIGRLLGDKGVRELIQAVRKLREVHPNIRTQLLGPLDGHNRTAISRSELNDWVSHGLVEYLGETDDVRPFIEKATAVVLPSYREGLPRSLLEAGAMGRPLVATDVPGCREVVDEGVNGFLCAPRNADSLADAMQRLVDLNPDERSTMGLASRRKVESKFSEAVVIQAYLDALGNVAPLRG
jgi:glycosyltransferase involved in cell wall biosynthesis